VFEAGAGLKIRVNCFAETLQPIIRTYQHQQRFLLSLQSDRKILKIWGVTIFREKFAKMQLLLRFSFCVAIKFDLVKEEPFFLLCVTFAFRCGVWAMELGIFLLRVSCRGAIPSFRAATVGRSFWVRLDGKALP
jgi:hypothetical protein